MSAIFSFYEYTFVLAFVLSNDYKYASCRQQNLRRYSLLYSSLATTCTVAAAQHLWALLTQQNSNAHPVLTYDRNPTKVVSRYSVNRSDYQFYTRAGVFEKKGKQMECARKQTIHNSSVDTARVVFFHNLYIVSATLTVIKYIFEQSTESASFL